MANTDIHDMFWFPFPLVERQLLGRRVQVLSGFVAEINGWALFVFKPLSKWLGNFVGWPVMSPTWSTPLVIHFYRYQYKIMRVQFTSHFYT
jgi:hypothetical protein